MEKTFVVKHPDLVASAKLAAQNWNEAFNDAGVDIHFNVLEQSNVPNALEIFGVHWGNEPHYSEMQGAFLKPRFLEKLKGRKPVIAINLDAESQVTLEAAQYYQELDKPEYYINDDVSGNAVYVQMQDGNVLVMLPNKGTNASSENVNDYHFWLVPASKNTNVIAHEMGHSVGLDDVETMQEVGAHSERSLMQGNFVNQAIVTVKEALQVAKIYGLK